MELVDKFEISDLYRIKDIGEILRLQVEKRAQDPAIFCEDRVLSYAALQRHSQAVATYLASQPSMGDQRIGFIGRECEAYYEVLFGCAQAGTIFVPINWRLTPREVAHILTDAGIAILFCDAGTLNIVEESLRASGHRAEVVCSNEGLTLIDYGSVLRTDPSKQIPSYS